MSNSCGKQSFPCCPFSKCLCCFPSFFISICKRIPNWTVNCIGQIDTRTFWGSTSLLCRQNGSFPKTIKNKTTEVIYSHFSHLFTGVYVLLWTPVWDLKVLERSMLFFEGVTFCSREVFHKTLNKKLDELLL